MKLSHGVGNFLRRGSVSPAISILVHPNPSIPSTKDIKSSTKQKAVTIAKPTNPKGSLPMNKRKQVSPTISETAFATEKKVFAMPFPIGPIENLDSVSDYSNEDAEKDDNVDDNFFQHKIAQKSQ